MVQISATGLEQLTLLSGKPPDRLHREGRILGIWASLLKICILWEPWWNWMQQQSPHHPLAWIHWELIAANTTFYPNVVWVNRQVCIPGISQISIIFKQLHPWRGRLSCPPPQGAHLISLIQNLKPNCNPIIQEWRTYGILDRQDSLEHSILVVWMVMRKQRMAERKVA